jgi:hypothetical protein
VSKQLNIFEAREARDQGINRAVMHADETIPDWSSKAYGLLLQFLSIHVGPFMTEEVRTYAAQIDFPLPPHARAWGGVMLRAVKAGIIQQAGTAKVKNVKAHCANAAIWRQVKKAS